jgi:predicted PurR-regulated permease PerM
MTATGVDADSNPVGIQGVNTNELTATRVLYRAAIFAIAMVALAFALLQLKFVIIQVFAAVIVAAGMAPLVARATDPNRAHIFGWRPPKAAVVVVIYLVIGLLLLVFGSIIIGNAINGLNTLVARAPEFATTIDAWVASLQAASPILADLHVLDLLGGTSGISQTLSSILKQALGAASLLFTIFGGFVNVLFVLFMALYMTVDGERILNYVIVFFPLSRQPQARRVMTNITDRLSHWVVGQLLLALVIGTVAGIGLGLLGVPAAPVLGMIWFIAEFMPGIGPFIAAVPSILLGFLAGPTTGVLATIFTFGWSQIESNVVTPRLMGRAVEINSLVILVALLVGNELLGLLGALFAIPAAAAIAVVVDEFRRQRVAYLAKEGDFGT